MKENRKPQNQRKTLTATTTTTMTMTMTMTMTVATTMTTTTTMITRQGPANHKTTILVYETQTFFFNVHTEIKLILILT